MHASPSRTSTFSCFVRLYCVGKSDMCGCKRSLSRAAKHSAASERDVHNYTEFPLCNVHAFFAEVPGIGNFDKGDRVPVGTCQCLEGLDVSMCKEKLLAAALMGTLFASFIIAGIIAGIILFVVRNGCIAMEFAFD
jgi:hypothetical protein